MGDARPAATSAEYEVAREILLELIGYASARTDEPEWAERLRIWQARLESLRPDAGDEIRAVLRTGPGELAAIRSG